VAAPLDSSAEDYDATIQISDYGFPTFRCDRPVTSEDVTALDEEESVFLPDLDTLRSSD
jgi:hypothetical protein